MQVNSMAGRFLIAIPLGLVVAACSSSPVRGDAQWIDANMGVMVIREKDRVPDQDIFQLGVDVEREVANSMLGAGLKIASLDQITLGDVPHGARERLEEKGGHLYLLRAISGEVEGEFSVYSNGQMVQVLYSHFGECGVTTRRVVLVRLDAAPVRAFAGCSGAL